MPNNNYLRILKAELEIIQSKKKDITKDLITAKRVMIKMRKENGINTNLLEKELKELLEA